MTLEQGSEMFGCESKLRKKKLCIWLRETIKQQGEVHREPSL